MTMTEAKRTRAEAHTEQRQSEMQQLAERVERHHTAPLPDAEAPAQHPFPPRVVTTLWLGIVGGGVFGTLLGVLLRSYVLVIPGVEGLYSMGPFTFQFFCMMAGVTLGIVGAAVATLLIPPPEYRAERGEDAERVDVNTTEAGNILEVDLDDAGT